MKLYIHPEYEGSQHELLKSILKSAPHGIMTLKSIRDDSGSIEDFGLIMVNKNIERLLGFKGRDLLGGKFLDLHESKEWEELFQIFRETFNEDTSIKIVRYFEMNKKPVWIQISGVHYNDAITLHFVDVTELQESISLLEKSEKKYRVLFEESLEPIFLMDTELRINNHNLSFEKQFGFPKKDLKELSLADLLPGKNDLERIKAAVENQEPTGEFEIRFLNKKGSERSCIINCVPLIIEENSEIVFLSVMWDITDRKKTEKDLIYAEQLSTSGKLARIIAHEVRNPLTNINLAINELEEELGGNDNDSKLYFDLLKRNTSRIQSLIRDLLNTAKPRELKLKEGSINEVVRDTVKFVRDRMVLQDMTLNENYQEEMPLIKIDEDQLKVAILNLLLNAVEAMEPGKGILDIKTENGHKDYIYIIINDNGKGIREEDIPKLFDPFFTRKKEGSGLGLTATKNIIHSHKGEIFVESKKGSGTTFMLRFPF